MLAGAGENVRSSGHIFQVCHGPRRSEVSFKMEEKFQKSASLCFQRLVKIDPVYEREMTV